MEIEGESCLVLMLNNGKRFAETFLPYSMMMGNRRLIREWLDKIMVSLIDNVYEDLPSGYDNE